MYNALKDTLAKAVYKRDSKLVTGVNGDIIQLTQDLLDLVGSSSRGNSNGGSGTFLGIANSRTIPAYELGGFYFSSDKGTYINFIGKNNNPITINGDFEVIYCIKENDELIWVHENIQINTVADVETVSYEDINNIIRN